MTKPSTGLKLALELLREYENEWDGGEQDPAVLAATTYAVCVKRSGDGWVYACENWQEVVDTYAACLLTDSSDTEWVNAIYEVATGKTIAVPTSTTVALRAPDGEIFYSFSPAYDPTWTIVLRDPDYENQYESFVGLTPGVRTIDIDTGADFSNGRPSRYWCADRYFGLEDDTPTNVKRAVLKTLTMLAERADKYPKGKDPGTW